MYYCLQIIIYFSFQPQLAINMYDGYIILLYCIFIVESADEKQDVPSNWLKNSSFEPEASELVNKVIEDDKKKEHKQNVRNSYKLYKKLHGKKKKKKDKKHVKRTKRPK